MCSSMCSVPGPVSRVHFEIALLMRLYYLILFVNGKTSVSLTKSWLFLRNNQSSSDMIPQHWDSLKVMARKPTHGLRPVLLVYGNKGCCQRQ